MYHMVKAILFLQEAVLLMKSSLFRCSIKPKITFKLQFFLFSVLTVIAFTSCSKSSTNGGDSIDDEVEAFLGSMTIQEKIQQMQGGDYAWGDHFNFKTPNNERLQIPGFMMCNGTRGMSARYATENATTFPVAMARAATWDPEIESQVAQIVAVEAKAWGYNMVFAPTINQLTHPRWGRAQETYGEDVCLLSKFGVAYINSVQSQPEDGSNPIISVVKHFAANNIENTRFSVNARLDERTLREVYLPHFKKAVDEANVAVMMTAYNKVNGYYASQNHHMVREILKGEWGFQGMVLSDFGAVHATVDSVEAGLDLEHPFSLGENPYKEFVEGYFYGDELVSSVNDGDVPIDLIDDAVRRILKTKLQYKLDYYDLIGGENPPRDQSLLETDEHVAKALEVAEKSIVLLENKNNTLPLNRSAVSNIVVVGEFANKVRTGDQGSSESVSSSGVSPYMGISSIAGEGVTVTTQVTVEENTAAVAAADYVIVIGAYSHREEGEGKPFANDRVSMALPSDEVTAIKSALANNSNVIVILESAGAVDMKAWADDDANSENLKAVIMAWYPGMRGGTAIGEILFGDVNPSGKLPQAFPVQESDYPVFDTTSYEVKYDYYHGYRYLDKHNIAPRYHFGYGLSYTTYNYSDLQVQEDTVTEDDTVTVTVDVTNTGTIAGDEIVQLYVGFLNSTVADSIGRPVKELKDFKRISLEPNETKTVELQFAVKDLGYYDTDSSSWIYEKMEYQVFVGPSSDISDTNMKTGSFAVQ